MDLTKICRSCLENHPKMSQLFQNNTNKIFTSCTSIPLETNDDLPQLICHQCLEQIKQFYKFKKKCWEADGVLRQHLKEVETRRIKEEIQELETIDLDAIDEEMFAKSLKEVKQEIEEDQQLREKLGIIEMEVEDIPKTQEEEQPLGVILKTQLGIIKKECLDNTQEEQLGIIKKEVVQYLDNPNTQEELQQLGIIKKEVIDLQFLDKEIQLKLLKTQQEVRKNVAHLQNLDKASEEVNQEINQLQVSVNDFNTRMSLEEDSLTCPFCPKVFQQKIHLTNHLQSHQSRKLLKCSSCPETFPNEDLLQNHVTKTHSSFMEKCPKCGEKFDNYRKFEAHILGHIGKDDVSCFICHKTSSKLKEHIQCHFKDKLFFCNTCGLSYTSWSCYQIHMGRHLYRAQICKLCGKSFRDKTDLEEHSVVHKQGQGKMFFCGHCNKAFWEEKDLVQHLKSHKTRSPFDCRFCGKKFTNIRQLHAHFKVHKSQKPYECKVCKRGFGVLSGLKKHFKVHPQQI